MYPESQFTCPTHPASPLYLKYYTTKYHNTTKKKPVMKCTINKVKPPQNRKTMKWFRLQFLELVLILSSKINILLTSAVQLLNIQNEYSNSFSQL